MSIDTLPPTFRTDASPLRDAGPIALAAFGLALFSSALLIFWVEPLFARMLLPRAGGSQLVWNTCLVFFQASLLLGYSYAHLLARFLPLRGQVLAHLVVIASGLLFLPLTLAPGWAPPGDSSPIPALFAILITALGWPFFALSANAPLLQHWFSFTCHRQAENPYVLYAASNAGSLAALLAYPFLIEPNITLHAQASFWTFCYGALFLMIAFSAALALRPGATTLAARPQLASERAGWSQRLTWLLYAAVPSSLLIGVTSYVSTDVAAFPLLWIAPLALYLATFIVTFSSRPFLPHADMVRMLPLAILMAACGLWLAPVSLMLAVGVHFLAFFLICMACHGELARRKPPVAQLTEFYFWMSLGGVVGGALTALVSPLLFDTIIEYPLVLACVCLLPLTARLARRERLVLLGTAIIVLAEPLMPYGVSLSLGVTFGLIVLMAAFGMMPKRNFALLVLALLLASHAGRNFAVRHGAPQWRERSYYGAYTVTDDDAGYRMMYHGTTAHGLERYGETGRPEPLLYYAPAGPLGDVMRNVGQKGRTIGVIGLGIGNMACWGVATQSWTFYEIDPLVQHLAADSGLFRSLPLCVPDTKVILGDGRLKLEAAAPGAYDMFIVDAFSSDAIPIHLMTREAFEGYRRALSEHGVLLLHITNRHFDLAPIVARIAGETGLVAYEWSFTPPPGVDLALGAPTRWMVLARDAADLGVLATNGNWTRREPQAGTKLWTDDFANILSALR